MRSPYMNLREVAEYLRFIDGDGTLNLRAAREWIDRRKLETKTRDTERSILVYRSDVEAALRQRTVRQGRRKYRR